jgi:hypothetical protein
MGMWGTPTAEAFVIVLFSVAAFSGAALLFILALMFSRMVLPLLGGTASVWTTCLLFYQFVLLAGYAYSHLLPGKLGLRRLNQQVSHPDTPALRGMIAKVSHLIDVNEGDPK